MSETPSNARQIVDAIIDVVLGVQRQGVEISEQLREELTGRIEWWLAHQPKGVGNPTDPGNAKQESSGK